MRRGDVPCRGTDLAVTETWWRWCKRGRRPHQKHSCWYKLQVTTQSFQKKGNNKTCNISLKKREWIQKAWCKKKGEVVIFIVIHGDKLLCNVTHVTNSKTTWHNIIYCYQDVLLLRNKYHNKKASIKIFLNSWHSYCRHLQMGCQECLWSPRGEWCWGYWRRSSCGLSSPGEAARRHQL